MAILPSLPSPSLPLVDSSGKITPVWLQYLNALQQNVAGANNQNVITVAGVTSTGPIVGTNGTFSGTMEFGAYTAGTFNQTGYIFINDKTGTVRRLMVG